MPLSEFSRKIKKGLRSQVTRAFSAPRIEPVRESYSEVIARHIPREKKLLTNIQFSEMRG